MMKRSIDYFVQNIPPNIIFLISLKIRNLLKAKFLIDLKAQLTNGSVRIA